MHTLIDNQPLVVNSRDGDEEKLAKSPEYKEITEAISVLAKHCKSFIISSMDDKMSFVYNHATGEHLSVTNSRLHKSVKKDMGEQKAKNALRATDLATHITHLIADGRVTHNVDPDALLTCIDKGTKALTVLNKLDKFDKAEFMAKMSRAKTAKEGVDIVERELFNKKPHFDPDKFQSLRDAFKGIAKEATENDQHCFKFGDDGEWENVSLEEIVKKDPKLIMSITDALSKSLNATVILGCVRLGEDGELTDDGTIVAGTYQKNAEEIAEDTGLDYDKMKVSLAGCIATSILEKLKNEHDLPDGFFEEYMRRNDL